MSSTEDTRPWAQSQGGLAALSVYVLYLLSIPSAGVLALIGVIVAYAARGESAGVARTHIEDQIRVWWVAFFWGAGILVASVIGWVLAFVLIGFPILWIAAGLGFIVMVWFTVKSLLGLLALMNGRPRGGALI